MTKKHIEDSSDVAAGKRIAIIGGGIAGLYCAWRLLNDKKFSCQITVFEARKECGGRIASWPVPGSPFPAELGAMRFRANHRLLSGIVNAFELPICGFDLPPPMLFLRGRSLSPINIETGRCQTCGGSIPFRLRPEERGKTPEALVLLATSRFLASLSFPTLPSQTKAARLREKIRRKAITDDAWELIKRYGRMGNIEICNIGFRNVLQHFLSNEAFCLLQDALSLDSVIGNWSAAEAIPWFIADFSSNDLLTIQGGVSQVINKIMSAVKEKGGDIILERKVTKVKPSEGGYTLQFDDTNADASGFDAVVLALPYKPLQSIKVTIPGWEEKTKWMDWVTPHRLFKLFLVFEEEWWIGESFPGDDTGRVYTDLPLRQVYYFSPRWMEAHGLQGTEAQRAMVMASYSDAHFVSFWGPTIPGHTTAREKPYFRIPLQVSEEEQALMDNVFKGASPPGIATERMVEKVLQQMSELHPGKEIPRPIYGIYRDWGTSPFFGGWHTWNVGARPWEKRIERIQPIPDYDVYIVGESFSNEQGWIEGALKTSECAIRRLGGAQPSWMAQIPSDAFRTYIDDSAPKSALVGSDDNTSG